MPSFAGRERSLKRRVWDWLLREAHRLSGSPAIIVGDFNTAPTDSERDCGDRLKRLAATGWQHPQPASGYSWRHPRGGQERKIDHIFLSRVLVPIHVEYLWSFEALATDADARKVGQPDHAMLLCTFVSEQLALQTSWRRNSSVKGGI